jgi:hypothetical protein
MKKEFSEILINIEYFEFEDRKHIQRFIGDLDLQFREIIEETLELYKDEVVSTIVQKYDSPGLSLFVGNILRLYSKTNRLVGAFLHMEIL